MPSNDAKCPECGSDPVDDWNYECGSVMDGWLVKRSPKCLESELASLKQSLDDEKQKREAAERSLNNCQDERAADFAKWFQLMNYGGLTEYQPECAIVVDEWLRELMQLRHLAYAVKEFLHPQEWKFHQPSHRPGLDAKLIDIEDAANRTLGDCWRDEHEKHDALLAQPAKEGSGG